LTVVRQADKQAKQIKQYHMLIQLGQELISNLELRTVLDLITKDATELLNSHSSVLLLRDDSTHETTYVSVHNVTDQLLEKKLLSSESLGNQIIDNKRPIILDDYSRYPRKVALLEPYGIKAVIGVPIIWQEEAIGSLNVHAVDPDKRFNEDDVDLLLGFANYAAIAIINAKLYSRTTEKLKNIKMLSEISHISDSDYTLQELVAWLTTKIKSFYPQNDYMLIVQSPFMGSYVYSSNAVLDPAYITQLKGLADEYIIKQSNNSSVINLICDSGNILAFPLVRKQKVLGHLLVFNNELDKKTIQIMDNIASHISVTMDNFLLHLQAHSDLEQIIDETNALNYAIRKVTELVLGDDLSRQILNLALFLAKANKGCLFMYSLQDNSFIARSLQNMSEKAKEELIDILGQFYNSFPPSKIITPKINLSIFAKLLDTGDLSNPYILPLIFREQLIGALVIDTCGRDISNSGLLLMQIFADIAAIAIANADLYQNEKMMVNDMREFSRQLLESQKLLEDVFNIHNELLRQVLNGSTIDQIAEVVYQNTNNPILVEDSAGSPLARFPSDYGAPTVYSKLNDADFIQKYRDFLIEKKPTFCDETENTLRYVVPLVASDKIVGFISTFATAASLTPWQKHITESSALAFSMAIVNANRALEIEQAFKGEILEALIDEKYLQRKDDILRRASYMRLREDVNYRLIVIDFLSDHSPQTPATEGQHEPSVFDKRLIIESLGNISRKSPARFFFINNQQGIVVAYPIIDDTKKEIVHLCSLLIDDFYARYRKKYSFVMGVSSKLTNLLEFRRGFLEACRCVIIGRTCKNTNKPTFFEDSGLLGFLFHDENVQLLMDFVRNTIGSLVAHDEHHNLALVDTLECYLDNNCNLNDTSKSLYIHVNTLKYRLKKIKDIASIDPIKTDERVNLYAACKMYRILSKNEGTYQSTTLA